MRLDVFEFRLGERARLAEHVVVDADLADVVQQAGEIDRVQLVVGAADAAARQTESRATRSL